MSAETPSRVETFPRVVARAAARRAGPRRPWGAIALFLGPTLLLYFAFAIYPVLVTFYNSVHSLRMDLGMQYEFVGLAHFREILTSDEVFWKAAANSLTWGLVAPVIDIPLALGLALVLHARVPFARFFRTVWFTPVLMSYPVVGVIWLWVYNYDWGMANLVLRAVGLGGYAQAWLASPATALPALILVTTWMFAGFNMVVLLAAIHATLLKCADDTARTSPVLHPESSKSSRRSNASPRYVISWYSTKSAVKIGRSARMNAAASARCRRTANRPNSQSAAQTMTPATAASVKNDPPTNATASTGDVTKSRARNPPVK